MELKDYGRKILKDSDCDGVVYEGDTMKMLVEDLKAGFPSGMEYGYTYEEVAKAIWEICNTEKGYLPPVKIELDDDTSRYGLTDLFEYVYRKVEDAINSKKPFETDNFSSQKAEGWFKLSRRYINGKITVEVGRGGEEMIDLLYSAIPDGLVLTEQEENDITDLMSEDDEIPYEVSASIEIDENSTIKEILGDVEFLADDIDNTFDNAYKKTKSYVQDVINMRIKNLRTATGLSQGDYASFFNIPVRTLQDWEQGKRTPPVYILTMMQRILELEGKIEVVSEEESEEE